MKNILYLLLILLLFSCKSKIELMLEKMQSAYLETLNDLTFKSNIHLKIIDLKIISYDTINENAFDSLRLNLCANQVEHFNKLANTEMENVSANSNLSRLSYSIGKNLGDDYKKTALEGVSKAKEYLDSSKFYLKLDSMIVKVIENRKNPQLMYKGKFYLKATLESNGRRENNLDTTYCYFDSQLKVKPVIL